MLLADSKVNAAGFKKKSNKNTHPFPLEKLELRHTLDFDNEHKVKTTIAKKQNQKTPNMPHTKNPTKPKNPNPQGNY